MRHDTSSRTARQAARHRAAHQLLDGGRLFADPLALQILGEDPAAIERDAREHPRRGELRTFIAARQHFAESALARAVGDGTRQFVVLGAGLDTFAYRNPYGELHVFEVDHPRTQAWKRECLARAAIEEPPTLSFAPLDLEEQSLAAALTAVGFDVASPAFFMWMGVVVYLSPESTWSTLRFIASLAARAEVVCDYSNPMAGLRAPEAVKYTEAAGRMAAIGEPWVNFLETPRFLEQLRAIGFSEIEDMGPAQIVARYVPGAAPPTNDIGAHLLHAAKP